MDCDGKPKAIPKAPLLFDINAQARFSVGNQKIPFVIQDQHGATVTDGLMNLIQGSDLFGVKGFNYFHWRINEFTFNNTDTKLYLNIDVSNLAWEPFAEKGEKIAGDFVFSTYLRLGDAEPVEQKVTWTN